MDPIDRQAAIDTARDWYEGLICGSFKGLEKRLRALPPAQSKQQWTPCSEKKPEKSGKYYVSGGGKVWICEFVILNSFTGVIGGWCNDASNPVVQAWMPLPKPYEERRKE